MNAQSPNTASVPDSNSSLQKIKYKLEFAENLLWGVAEATRILLTVVDYKQSIYSSLAVLGNSTQVDRVYIFQFHSHPSTQDPVVSQRYEWVKDGISQEIENPELQNLPFLDLFPRWYDQLPKGNSISGLIDTFPESEQAILIPQNILSIVVVPILIEGQFWGFMGFDDCLRGHAWSVSEVAALKAVANSFGGAIARHQAQETLQKANDTLSLLTRDLMKAKDQANQANHAKSLFIARMSHELRTPLNGILGYSQIIQRRTQDNTETSKGIQVISQCATHLLDLINDILDFSRMEADQLTIYPEPVKIHPLLDETIRICEVQALSKKIRLQQEISPDLPNTVLLDAKRLRQVLMNLLSNGIKFTDTGQVTLSVKLEEQYTQPTADTFEPTPVAKIKFDVSDTGIGISSEDTERIFEAFEQCGELNRKSDGTGLGLNISQRIVSAMGGSITVQSCLNSGSSFSFCLELPILETNHSRDSSFKSNKTDTHEEKATQITHSEPIDHHCSLVDIPEAEVLEHCWTLIQSGRLLRLKAYAEKKAKEIPKASQFLETISDLASNFRIEEVENLLRETLRNCD